MPVPLLQALVAFCLYETATALRTITIDNQCSGTIYPAFQTGSGDSPTQLDGSPQPAGWEQPTGKYQFNVPDTWTAARLWARTGCQANAVGCVIGGCGDKLACSGSESGGQGATLAEFTLISGGTDSYDVSMVDGFNLPMEIIPSIGSCITASCGAQTDILTACDPKLVYPAGSSQIWSCASACLAGINFQSITTIDFDYRNSPSCCTGTWKNHDTCTPDMIPFYAAYKSMCHNSYVYADDDNQPDAVFSCPGNPDYTITFCPGGLGSGINPPTTPVSQDMGSGSIGGNTTVSTSQAPVSTADGAVSTPYTYTPSPSQVEVPSTSSQPIVAVQSSVNWSRPPSSPAALYHEKSTVIGGAATSTVTKGDTVEVVVVETVVARNTKGHNDKWRGHRKREFRAAAALTWGVL